MTRQSKLSAVFSHLLMLLLVFAGQGFAGTTGKVAGKITDAQTGEPLLGVNVIIEGTSMGAATDMEGEYYILNIPPGTYSIRASMIGYTTKIFSEVEIQTDLTSRVDFELPQASIEMDEEVVITAKREIQKDLTSSERTMSSDDIQELPVKDVSSLLSMQAGVTRDAGGNLHIRGGRTTEISYMVDGVQVMNPLNRSAGISIDDQSISELKAITGTFNAEYGQALSGVVNIVTKKGADKFNMTLTAYAGDHVSFDSDIYYLMNNREWAEAAANALISRGNQGIDYDFGQHGIEGGYDLFQSIQSREKPWLSRETFLDDYDPTNNMDLQLNISGPVPFTGGNLSYFIAGRVQDSKGYSRGIRYYMPWGQWQPVSDTEHNFEMPDGKIMPLNWYEGYSTQSKLFFNSGPFSISYGIYYNNDHSYSGGQKYRPDGGRHYFTERMTHILSSTYVFSQSTFLELKGSFYQNDHESYLYEDPMDYRYMPTNAGDFQQYVFQPGRDDDIQVAGNPNDFSFWGNDVGRTNNLTNYWSVSADITSQINKNNMIKLGVMARMHNLEQDYYSLQFSQVDYRPIVPDESSAFRTRYDAQPSEFAAYFQDKIEFDELIINVGVRFDYFDSDGKILSDPADPQIYSPFKLDNIYKNYDPTLSDEELVKYTVEERREFWYEKPEAKYQISPRFGVSFPITDKGVIHFSYGHFFQNPEFQFMYTNPNFWITGAGAQNLVGNADLGAERTVMYELGLQQELFNGLFLHVTGFYRDIRDWVGTGFPVDTYRGVTYYSFVNKDHATSKGLTLAANYRLGDFSLSLDYTYQSAKGTSSDVNDAYNDLSANRPPRVQLIDLDWDQPHSLNLIVNYMKDGWIATLVGVMNSGFPYTPEFARGETSGSSAFIGLRENSERRPIIINLDLQFSKTFNLGPVKLTAIANITNLLDTRNANYVYADTGAPDFTLQDYLGWQRLVEISNTDEYFTRPGMYTSPRFIQLGLRLSY